MKSVLTILAVFLLFTNQNSNGFIKGEKLSKYFPLDSIEYIELTNWKGEHMLSNAKKKLLIRDLKTYFCNGNYAHTKPGHLRCIIKFKNQSKLHFYSNSESEIIISERASDFTFISKKKVNFEKY